MKTETKYHLLQLGVISCALCAVVGVFVGNIPAAVGFAIASFAVNYVARDNKPTPPPAV